MDSNNGFKRRKHKKEHGESSSEIYENPDNVETGKEDGPSSHKQPRKIGTREYRAYKRERTENKLEKQLQRTLDQQKVQSEQDKKNILQENRHTISIAVPGSILSIAQSQELQTYLVGQIARTAVIFKIDEIVVFDDTGTTRSDNAAAEDFLNLSSERRDCLKMARILQYLECPQYLRKYFFPFHKDLQFAGLLNPLDAPHHLRVQDESEFREGVVISDNAPETKGSLVYVGLNKSVRVDKRIVLHTRVTVKFVKSPNEDTKKLKGTLVAPDAPLKELGVYWGYKVRIAHSLGAVFCECPYKGGYDVTIGTSDKGSSVFDVSLPKFKHMLIVFGGQNGLEPSLEADERLEVNEINCLFDHYLNTCPNQGSRTIRTEEAILLSLAALQPKITECEISGLNNV